MFEDVSRGLAFLQEQLQPIEQDQRGASLL